MSKSYSVFIVEDHQINIDSYKTALDFVKNEIDNIDFIVSEVKTCEQAIDEMKSTNLKFDLVILDISLPPSIKYDILNGEVLGKIIKKNFPMCKFLVCTSYTDNFRLNNILHSLNPEAFLIKSDIDFIDLVSAVKKIINDGSYYSKTIINFMRNKINSDLILDELDVKILHEISNGSRMKELQDLIPLSKTGIERRKKYLKSAFNVKNSSDRELVLKAKEKGFL